MSDEVAMLTVKHRKLSGVEIVTSAALVEFHPYDVEPTDSKRHVVAQGVPWAVGTGWERYDEGTVYVMNYTGATIAKYTI